MNVMLKLTVNQVSTAILLLDQEEKDELAQRLPSLFTMTPEAREDFGWLNLTESAFQFWEDPVEDLYNDLIPDVEDVNISQTRDGDFLETMDYAKSSNPMRAKP